MRGEVDPLIKSKSYEIWLHFRDNGEGNYESVRILEG